MKSIYLFLTCLALACGGEAVSADPSTEPDFGPQIRIDTVPGDAFMDFGADPDNYHDSELGDLEQPWVSSEYYGRSGSGPCYANTPGSQCIFPQTKTFKLHVNASQCDLGWQPSWDYPKNLYTIMWSGFLAGVKAWNGHGGIQVFESTAGGAMWIDVKCKPLATSVGIGLTTSPSNITQIGNLPAGPHGGDPGAAKQYDGSTIDFDIQDSMRQWMFPFTSDGNSPCNMAATTTQQQIYDYGYRVGMHEMGHVVGFDHVASSAYLMYYGIGCDAAQIHLGIAPYMDTALTKYSGSTGQVRISDDGLPH